MILNGLMKNTTPLPKLSSRELIDLSQHEIDKFRNYPSRHTTFRGRPLIFPRRFEHPGLTKDLREPIQKFMI